MRLLCCLVFLFFWILFIVKLSVFDFGGGFIFFFLYGWGYLIILKFLKKGSFVFFIMVLLMNLIF